jgi:hypothetical protein
VLLKELIEVGKITPVIDRTYPLSLDPPMNVGPRGAPEIEGAL